MADECHIAFKGHRGGEGGVKVDKGVHDPKAIENTKSVFGNKIEYTENVSEVLRDSECGVIMTAWKQYTDISEKELELMKKRFIVDTRRLLFGKKLNIEYHAIGIG